MRALPLRRIATSALCATLLLGTAGPALAHDDTSRDKPGTAPRAPAPDANALAAQTQQLHALGGALNTVSELLTAVLKAKDNKLPPEDVKKHTEAVKKALEALAAAKPPAPKAVTDPANSQAHSSKGTQSRRTKQA
ncbi:hypothetical protein ABZ366_33185 [Streptomyces sp. NPDC005904]|uniref:hypothetical protein n=1 Tax=Streptomyces sp. NPDC005904 TaxID=3154570 RepID=UPI0033D04297